MGWYDLYPPYVKVADRRKNAAKEVQKLKRKGHICEPIAIEGRAIATTFWGKAWCENLDLYTDCENRLPRGRTYVRNGSVIDLKVTPGKIKALVSGSSIYKVKISIDKVLKDKWANIIEECSGKVDSLIELLQGKFSKAVMEIITDPEKGLFPDATEIEFSCSCSDWADMCKHSAAVLYGVGARFDERPEELFMLRQADYVELIAKASTISLTQTTIDKDDQILADGDLSSLFGIDMGEVSQKDLKTEEQDIKPKKKTIKEKPNKVVSVKAIRSSKVAATKKTPKKKASVTIDGNSGLIIAKTKAKSTPSTPKKYEVKKSIAQPLNAN